MPRPSAFIVPMLALLLPVFTIAQDITATQDHFQGDFPPLHYGADETQIEATAQAVIERVFRDEDGFLRGSVNGRTMKPLTPEDVKERPDGRGGRVEHAAIPNALKPVFMNYENAGEASGAYLVALCLKAQAAGDPSTRELARRTVAAIVMLWNNAAAAQGLGGGGRGWFPKPYGGIRNVAGIEECSADQYADITLGLHAYHRTLATAEEKRQIEDIIVSFSDWWHDHDHSGVYFGRPIWWKRLDWHPMAAAYFLYLHALAETCRPGDKSKRSFEAWLQLKDTLQHPDKPIGATMHGIPLLCLNELRTLRPDLDTVWMPAIRHQAELLARGLDEADEIQRYEMNAYCANYFALAHTLVPDANYDQLARRGLAAIKDRAHFYHLRRGQPLAKLSPFVRGDDYRDAFWCENHVHYLAAYWRLRAGKP